ncbi:MAG: hypothetical protein U1A78_34460 [Polyangia bacterium]
MFFAVRIVLLVLFGYGVSPARAAAPPQPPLVLTVPPPAPAADRVSIRFTASHLEVVRIDRDPSKPAQRLGRLLLGGHAVAWVRNGDVLYIALAPSDIIGVDVSDPRHPVEILRLDAEVAAHLMLVHGKLIAYQSSGTSLLYDASWPRKLVRLDPALPLKTQQTMSSAVQRLLLPVGQAERRPMRRAQLGLSIFPSLTATSVAAFRVDVGTDYTAASGLLAGGRMAFLSSLVNDWLPALAFSGLLGGSTRDLSAGLIAGLTVGYAYDEEKDHGLGRARGASFTTGALLGLSMRFGPPRDPFVRLSIEWVVGPSGLGLLPMAFLSVNLFNPPRFSVNIQGQDVSGCLQLGYEYRY